MAVAVRPRTWIAIVAGAAVAAAAVALAVALLAPPRTAATPAPSPAAAPAQSAAPAPSAAGAAAAEADRQHRLYRAYVSAALRGGVAAVAGLVGLEDCRSGHDACSDRLGRASAQVGALQDTLAGTPAPDCLAGPDRVLRDGLSLQREGLDAARAAVETRDHVRLAQGAVLIVAGLWRTGEAVAAARRSDC